jgi:hypothetical protein
MITLCEAIARMEGWLVSSSRCRRNHNPGNIRYGNFARLHGAVGTDGAFAIFDNDQDGFNAMSELLEAFYQGDTLRKAIERYAPTSENNTNLYIDNLTHWTGLTEDSILTQDLLNPPNLSNPIILNA